MENSEAKGLRSRQRVYHGKDRVIRALCYPLSKRYGRSGGVNVAIFGSASAARPRDRWMFMLSLTGEEILWANANVPATVPHEDI